MEGGRGGGENGTEGGERKWYEDVSSALFMESVEEHGRHRDVSHSFTQTSGNRC